MLNTPASSSQLVVAGRAIPYWRGLALPHILNKGKGDQTMETQKRRPDQIKELFRGKSFNVFEFKPAGIVGLMFTEKKVFLSIEEKDFIKTKEEFNKVIQPGMKEFSEIEPERRDIYEIFRGDFIRVGFDGYFLMLDIWENNVKLLFSFTEFKDFLNDVRILLKEEEKNETMEEGIIKELKMEMGSGLSTLIFEDGTSVLIESGFGVRQLNRCFGDEDLKGKKIFYKQDRGLMTYFEPEEEEGEDK